MNLSDIFNIEYGKFKLPIKKLKLGTTPLISSSGVNNGVVGFFDLKPIYCKVISVARTGSVGETFFHNYDCVINSDCMVLSPKFSLTDNEMFWYVLNIGNHKKKFSYGRKVTPERLGLIQLPSDIPKWVNKIKLESIDLSETFNNSKRISISTANWKYFKYMELFNIRKGKRLTESNFTSGFPVLSTGSLILDSFILSNSHFRPKLNLNFSFLIKETKNRAIY